VLVEKHKTLDSARGVIFCSQVDGCIAGLTDQYVSKAYHIHKEEQGKLLPTQTIFLTFESPDMPEWVIMLHRLYKVKAYLPNRIQCYKCQQFGHTQIWCTCDIMCPKCGVNDHGNLHNWPTSSPVFELFWFL